MDPVFNELSATVLSNSVPAARQRMQDFVSILRKIHRFGVSRVLRVERSFMSLGLAPGYVFQQWLNDGTVESEMRQFLKALVSRAPFVDDMFRPPVGGAVIEVECIFEGSGARGLGLCALNEWPAVSLTGDPRFMQTSLSVELNSIVEGEGEAEIEHDVLDVRSVCVEEHVSYHSTWFAQSVANELTTGTQIWARREAVFPFLTFCPGTEKQLDVFTGSETGFAQIIRHLRVLNDTAAAWRGGPFEPGGIPWSPESAETLSRKVYRDKRRFQLPDGRIEQFSYHSKPSGELVRIYFLPIADEQKVYVGYVGPKLSSVKFPNLA